MSVLPTTAALAKIKYWHVFKGLNLEHNDGADDFRKKLFSCSLQLYKCIRAKCMNERLS